MEQQKAEQGYRERMARLDAATALQEPDRVPFAPKVSGFFCTGYGMNWYDVMKDFRNCQGPVRSFLETYDPDLACVPSTFPMDAISALGKVNLRWPGPEHGLPLDAGFQQLDGTYLEDDEFDLFLNDPTHFILTKLLPRKNKALKGLEKVDLQQMFDLGQVMSLSVFADGEVRAALDALVRAGQAVAARKDQAAQVGRMVREMGYPTRGGVMWAPFDIYADSLRGLIQAVLDVKLMPEQCLAVVERIADMLIDREVAEFKARGEKFVFVPLHAGVDEFMSPQDYETFYWPTLRRMIWAIAEAGMVPYVFCEGKYDTRLEVLTDVPKGKVVYLFEQVDIARAKKILGGTACIAGNLPAALLICGRPEQVADETKRMLDICAPGGGFLMDTSIILDNADHENMRVWAETTRTYGVY